MSPSQHKTQPGSRKPAYEAATKPRPSPGRNSDNPGLQSASGRTCDAGSGEHAAQSAAPGAWAGSQAAAGPATRARAAPRVHWPVGRDQAGRAVFTPRPHLRSYLPSSSALRFLDSYVCLRLLAIVNFWQATRMKTPAVFWSESGGLSRSSSKLNAGSSSKPEVRVRLLEPWLIWLHMDVNVSYVDFEGALDTNDGPGERLQ